MNPEILSALRWLIALASGFIIGKGWLTAEQTTQLGGIVTGLAVLGWSIWNAHHQKNAKIEAKADGIILGTQIANPESPATLLDAEPKVQDAVNAKVEAAPPSAGSVL